MEKEIKTIYEDEDVVVCIKPAGVISEEGSASNPGMPLLLADKFSCTIFPVHRLDKTVGGLMVFAKNKKSAASLSSQIAQHKFEKCYYALTYGKTPDFDTFEDWLFKDVKSNKSFVVKRERKGVKKAKLSFEKECEGVVQDKTVSLVKVRLYTGRSHQIRVQFASRNFPLVGDNRYGAKDSFKDIELFSCGISFEHPKSKKRMTFESKPFENLYMSKLLG